MRSIDKRATELLIENGELVADTLRHLADNEIDSDYFAICCTNENGTETECELAITDYARQAAGTVDELVKALEAAEKRIAEQREYYEGVIADGGRRIAELEAIKPIGYFAYDTDGGFTNHETAERAQEEAQNAIDYFRGDACDGWSDEVSSVCWGGGHHAGGQ